MNPSSNLEKYVSRWLIVTIGYIITFFVALWVADLIRVAVFSVRYPDVDANMLDLSLLIKSNGKINALFNDGYQFSFFVGLFFLFQSLCVLGSTFWEKVSFVKTFAASTVIVLLFILLARWTILLFYTDVKQFENVLTSVFGRRKEMSDNEIFMMLTGIFAFFTLINWTISFFRFRESEIIKRW